MKTIIEIENAIIKLSKKDIIEFRKWFIYNDNKKWDKEIKNDVKSGLLDNLVQEAINDYESGEFRKI